MDSGEIYNIYGITVESDNYRIVNQPSRFNILIPSNSRLSEEDIDVFACRNGKLSTLNIGTDQQGCFTRDGYITISSYAPIFAIARKGTEPMSTNVSQSDSGRSGILKDAHAFTPDDGDDDEDEDKTDFYFALVLGAVVVLGVLFFLLRALRHRVQSIYTCDHE